MKEYEREGVRMGKYEIKGERKMKYKILWTPEAILLHIHFFFNSSLLIFFIVLGHATKIHYFSSVLPLQTLGTYKPVPCS